MRPNFLIIGAMKCGTTSLHQYLAAHPQVFVTKPKELRFFSGENWDRGIGWYEAHFAGVGDEIAIGEASPTYSQATVYPGVPARIAAHLPGVRLIYVVRHPIERIRSMYLHRVVRGIEKRSIEQALTEDESYVATSSYAFQIEQYLPHIDRGRLHVLTAENLLNDRDRTYAAVLEFLGVDTHVRPAALSREVHRSAGKRVETRVGGRAISTLRSVGVLDRLPERARRGLYHLATRPVDPTIADLPAAVENQLRARLSQDVGRLRDIAGPAVDAWGI